MIKKELVRRKLNKLIQYLQELDTIKNYTLEEYLDNFFIKRTTERLLQMIVETATDINGHIVVDNGNPPPGNYYESFILLYHQGIINKKFAEKLAPSAGLRNRLVHEYDDINDKIVFESVTTALDMYKKYIKIIERYLEIDDQ